MASDLVKVSALVVVAIVVITVCAWAIARRNRMSPQRLRGALEGPKQVSSILENLMFQNQVVAFVDLLGLRDEIRQLQQVPKSDADKRQFMGVLRKTLVPIAELRESFQDIFDRYRKHGENLDGFPSKDRERVRRLRSVAASTYGLSDAVVITVPLMLGEDRPLPITGVWATLGAVSGLWLASLAVGRPFRAGIEIGVGAMIDGNEPFGSALVRAYDLESHAAEYPRVVVGDHLRRYLENGHTEFEDAKEEEWFRRLAGMAKRQMIQDSDGVWMLHPLGEEFWSTFGGKGIDSDTVRRAYEYVEQQIEMHVGSDNPKLAARYTTLLAYFDKYKSS